MKMRSYDVVIAGAGPAGLMCAYHAAKRGLGVLVVEKNQQSAKKLRITGKGRCNLINACEVSEFLENIRRNSKFLYSSIYSFPPSEIMSFFENRDLPLVIERGNRVFPLSSNAHDVAETLIFAAKREGVRIIKGRVSGIRVIENTVSSVMVDGTRQITCKAAVIATGGMSYPKTGSDGDGYMLAKELSHTVIPVRGSLVPIVCDGDEACMQGLSLRNVELIAEKNKRIIFKQMGELLFTHFGVSGPLILSLSSHLLDENLKDINVYIDLKPALDDNKLEKRIIRDFRENSNKDFANSLDALLPKKLIPIVMARSKIPHDKKINSITVAERKAIIDIVKHFSLSLKEFRPIDEAVVTAGGIDVNEVDPKTMMSKKINNLYFAGEVLDVDGYTGGFNLGIAFATGAKAGNSIQINKE